MKRHLLALLLVTCAAVYAGGYLAARASHVLVHATVTFDSTGGLEDFGDAIVPGQSMQGATPSLLARASRYFFFPLLKAETVIWRVRSRPHADM